MKTKQLILMGAVALVIAGCDSGNKPAGQTPIETNAPPAASMTPPPANTPAPAAPDAPKPAQ